MSINSHRRQAVTRVGKHHSFARLYHAVILRAVRDLAQKQHRDAAREWLLSPESDHAFATAGINPHDIRLQVF
jgi:hypothetical protein